MLVELADLIQELRIDVVLPNYCIAHHDIDSDNSRIVLESRAYTRKLTLIFNPKM